MIRRNALLGLAAVAAAFTMSGCDRLQQKAPGETKAPTTINFSILSVENSQNSEQLWTPFLEDMQKQTGLKVKAFYASNYTSLVEAMRFNQVQVGWFSNLPGLEAVRRADGEVFAHATDGRGIDGYNSLVLVNAKSNITLDDLLKCGKRYSFGLGDAKSTSGTLAPMTWLFAPKNIDPQTCFKTVRSANHQANLMSVAMGQIDAATNNSTSLRLVSESKPEIAAKLKVIWTSPKLPEDPLIWRKDLDPAVKEKIRSFILSYGTGTGPEAERQRKILAALTYGPFKPADNSHLLPVREMETTEKLIEARNAHDQAGVAAAEKELAVIRKEEAAAAAKNPDLSVDAPSSAAAPAAAKS